MSPEKTPDQLTLEEMSPEQIKITRDQVRQEMVSGESTVLDIDAEPTADDTKQEPKHGDEAVADPWEGIDPSIKAQFDEMSTVIAEAKDTGARLKQAESRIGALTNQLSAEKESAAKATPTASEIEAASESDEAWKELAEDYPEWGSAIDGRIDMRIKKLKSEGGLTKADLDAAVSQVRTEMSDEFEIKTLANAYSNWTEIKARPDYIEWAKVQDADILAKMKTRNAADAISVLDKYTEDRGTSKSAAQIAVERKERLRAGLLPEGHQPHIPKSELDMSETEYRQKIGRQLWPKTG